MKTDAASLRSLKASFLDTDAGKYAVAVSEGAARDVYKIEGRKATLIGSTPNGDGIHRIIAGHESGIPVSPSANAFFSAVDADVGSVRPSVTQAAAAAGFEAYNSGGGCMVWFRDLGDGSHVYVTSQDETTGSDIDGDPDAAAWGVGRYGDDGSSVDLTTPLTLAQAFDAGARLPNPEGADRQVAFATLEEALAGWDAEESPKSGM